MDERRLEWPRFLARALRWAALAVLALAAIAAIAVAGSSSDRFVLGEVEREGRAVFAISALGGGIAAAGLLAGIGAILELMLVDRSRADD